MDMTLPGITVRPLVDMTGERHFNEVFFDNVRVPRKCLVGQINRGWYQITVQLDFERSGVERVMGNYPLLEGLIDHVRRAGNSNELVRNKVAQMAIEFEVGRLLVYRVAGMFEGGKLPNYEAAMAKTFCTEYEQRLARCAMEVLGPYGQLGAGHWGSRLSGYAMSSYLYSPGYTLMGGTSEILRNIIATRGLQLPSK